MFAKGIRSPDDDPQFQELRQQQGAAHEEIRANSEIVERYKAQQKTSEHVLAGNLRYAPTREETKRAKAASRAVRAARAKLRDLEMPLRDTRAAASRRIAAEVRPDYLKFLGEFTLAVLRRRADELIAIERALAMRAEMNALRISMATLPIPPFERSLERTEWRCQVVREDTLAMIHIGAIKPGDLPSALRKLWRL